MEKALGTRLIVCCLECYLLGHLLFLFTVECVPDFGSVGRSVGQKRKKAKKNREVSKGGLVPQHNNMWSLEMTRRGENQT